MMYKKFDKKYLKCSRISGKTLVYELILQKMLNSVRLFIGLLRNLAGRTLTHKTIILVGFQSILYSQLIYFTYIYISEAIT